MCRTGPARCIPAILRSITPGVASPLHLLRSSRSLGTRRQLDRGFRHSPLALGFVDPAGGFTRVNAALCALLERDAATLLATDVLTLTHPDDLALTRERLTDAGNGVRVAFEKRFVLPGGGACWVAVRATPLLDRRGRVVGFLSQFEDVSPRREAEDRLRASEAQLRHRSLHDPLTQLPNRMLLLDRLRTALPRARRSGRAVGVLFVDVDDFKDVNDTGGHDAGDRLLQAVALRLAQALRAGDTLARFGGDEFVVLCEELEGPDEALVIAHRLLEACAGPVEVQGGEAFRLSASIGVAVAGGEAGAVDLAADGLVRDADLAMYRAKGAGKGRVELFDHAMREVALRRAALTHDLDRAIERDELFLVFQPIVSLTDGRIYGAEALLRWRHPERGLIGPDEFIGLAERNGRIIELGRWVLDEAARHAAGWPGLCVGVNVSRRQLGDPDLVGAVAAALERHGVEPERFVVEVTESALVEDPARAAQALDALHEMGVRLALDDFGTGQSSLGSVSEFPLDTLKLDRTFLTARRPDEQRWSIVRAVTEMGRALRLDVVAEGVETAEQRDALTALGCDFGQGYLFSRPVAPEAIAPLLQSANTARALPPR